MKDVKTKSKNITAWYWYSAIGTVGAIVGGAIGGGIGALITILLGHIFLLISLIVAPARGIKSDNGNGKVSIGSRIGAFFLALLIAIIALGINGSLA